MGIKHYLRLFVILLVSFGTLHSSHAELVADSGYAVSTAGSGAASNAVDRFSHGLLWRVSRPGAQPSYLLGTIHSEDARVLATIDTFAPILLAADSLVLETDLSSAGSADFAKSMIFLDGRSLREVLDDELLRRVLEAAVKRGLPAEQAIFFKPWAIMTVLSMPEPETGVFLDRALHELAVKNDVAVAGLESTAEQVAAMDGMSMSDQVALLRETMTQIEDMSTMLEAMLGAYLARDLARLESLYEEFASDTDQDLEATFRDRLVTNRNHVMAERMQTFLQQGNAFIAVGALHLAGEEGLLRLLTAQGYQLERADN